MTLSFHTQKLRLADSTGIYACCFVSHSTGSVRSVCERALWLDHGELVMDGDAAEVVSVYEGQLPEALKP